MANNQSGMGLKTLNALTFKLSVTQILTQVANDDFFFKFDDGIITQLLHDAFVDNDSIHESKCDTEEDVSAKVAEFLQSGTESEKQEKALVISKTIVETTEVSETEREEILAKLDKLGEMLRKNDMEIENDVSEDSSPTAEDYSGVTSIDFTVNKAQSFEYPSTMVLEVDRAQSLDSPLRNPWNVELDGEETSSEDTTDEVKNQLSSSLPAGLPTTTDKRIEINLSKTAPVPGTKASLSRSAGSRMKKLKKKLSWKIPRVESPVAINFSDNRPETKHDWVKDLRSETKRESKRSKKPKLKKKRTLSQLIKSKMISIKFMTRVSAQAELQKLQELKRQQDAKNLKDWLEAKRKKGKKKQQKFDIRSYSVETGETNVHSLRVGGMRIPYDLEGVQFVPAERLGAWREAEKGKKKWSAAFHTAKFPTPPNRAQTHKLKNHTTARRSIKPRLIRFGEFGEVEWLMCLKSQDAHYQLHAENMTRLQVARKMLRENRRKKNNS